MKKRSFAEVSPDVEDALNEDEDESGDDISVGPASKGKSSSTLNTGRAAYTNKQRVLIISSRGITARNRHLLEDFKQLIPHHKKDNKLDDKGDINAVNEIAEMKSCNQVLYLETRKHQDLYLYLGRTPEGPSAKFHVVNIHTMDELKLTGNCMLGSRPLLNFDTAFEARPHLQVMKQILADAFGTPLGHPKSKPFHDRVMSFFIIKGNIWVRNYQVIDKMADQTTGSTSSGSGSSNTSAKKGEVQLVEIGPRFVLIPIRIFSGSLGGPTLYQNAAFVSPNQERALYKKQKGSKYVQRVTHNQQRKEFIEENQLPPDELSSKNVFKD